MLQFLWGYFKDVKELAILIKDAKEVTFERNWGRDKIRRISRAYFFLKRQVIMDGTSKDIRQF